MLFAPSLVKSHHSSFLFVFGFSPFFCREGPTVDFLEEFCVRLGLADELFSALMP